MRFSRAFTAFAAVVAKVSGRPITFALCVVVILVWAATGPMFHYSDTWQLIINTGTTIVTFLMVFLIQNTQNRDGAAIQTKLDELIRASAAQNVFIGIEHLTEEEVEKMRKMCETRAKGFVADRLTKAADAAEEKASAKASKAAIRAVT